MSMNRTLLLRGRWLALGISLVLGGCAAFNNLDNEVSSYGTWPVDRKPGSYAFERLPSEQAHPERRQMLEDSARGALESAGFGPDADAQEAEYLIQLAARVSSNDPWVDSNLLFWPGPWGFGYPFGYGYRPGRWARAPWGFGGGWGWGWGLGYNSPAYFERDVALLIRDRKNGQLLYEARASTSGTSPTIESLLAPMFKAALADFPGSRPDPHSVTVPLAKP
jgi:hypothetical protein